MSKLKLSRETKGYLGAAFVMARGEGENRDLLRVKDHLFMHVYVCVSMSMYVCLGLTRRDGGNRYLG
jgi:hypothetical protein